MDVKFIVASGKFSIAVRKAVNKRLREIANAKEPRRYEAIRRAFWKALADGDITDFDGIAVWVPRGTPKIES